MAELISPEDERRLAERLRSEAEAQRPAFSEELHRRIVDAVAPRNVRPRTTGGRRTWLAVALVAGVVIAATVAVSRYLDRETPEGPVPRETAVAPREKLPSPEPPPQPKLPPPQRKLPPPQPVEQPRLDPLDAVAGGTAETVGNLVDATLTKSQWAYLDHDARLAADLMLAQLPLDLGLLGQEEEIEQ